MKQDLMKGVIDMHVHTNPDLRLRAYDDFELMEAAIRRSRPDPSWKWRLHVQYGCPHRWHPD